MKRLFPIALLACLIASAAFAADPPVGPMPGGGYMVTTRQLIRPAGQSIEFAGRPVDMALSPDAKTLYLKTNTSLLVIDTSTWRIRQDLEIKVASGSYHGIAVTRDGSKVYLGNSGYILMEADVAPDGKVSMGRSIDVRPPDGKGASVLCGIALSPGENIAYVCLSRVNALAAVDLGSGKVIRYIDVGVAPFDVVLSPDGLTAWVSNWGGRMAREGERTENSAGTPVLVDERTVGCSGTVSLVDLRGGKEITQVEVGLHPSDLELTPDGATLYVANANSDTVSVIDTRTRQVRRTIDMKPDASLPFGSAPNALALHSATGRLYVANGGNNAVAVVDGAVRGFIPAGWYPGAIVTDGKYLYIANVKGYGSRNIEAAKKQGEGSINADGRPNTKWLVHMALGTVQKVPIPDPAQLASYTRRVHADAQVPQILQAQEKAETGVKPRVVPEHVGEPSRIEHVIYIIKENKTYDQVFGDLPRGNNDPKLCVFGREITPNQHALAEQFVQLDNYYCSGVCSADGHQWAVEGYATDYMEKGFAGWPRSYPYSGDDAMAYSPAGFIWDNVLLHGLSFRNYGEMGHGVKGVDKSYGEYIKASQAGADPPAFQSTFEIDALRRYSCPAYPGWTLNVPDLVRADIFLKEFAEFERTGRMPAFITMHLPVDHTAGSSPGAPTPRAYVADNDLAVGRIVEAVSKSKFWPNTCIFINEDDPQSGYDHVDGHRSLCLVVSPYTKRGALISSFYNQGSVLHTIELMLGIPPMNQMDSMAPVMADCFTETPDLTPYTALPSQVPLDEVNPRKSALSGDALHWAEVSLAQDLSGPDMVDDNALNRAIWHSMKGVDTPYPVAFAGAHGKGLKALGLALDLDAEDED